MKNWQVIEIARFDSATDLEATIERLSLDGYELMMVSDRFMVFKKKENNVGFKKTSNAAKSV